MENTIVKYLVEPGKEPLALMWLVGYPSNVEIEKERDGIIEKIVHVFVKGTEKELSPIKRILKSNGIRLTPVVEEAEEELEEEIEENEEEIEEGDSIKISEE